MLPNKASVPEPFVFSPPELEIMLEPGRQYVSRGPKKVDDHATGDLKKR